MSRSVALILACLTAVLAVCVVSGLDRSRYDPAASYQEKITYWKTRIDTVGGKRAYEEMAVAQGELTTGAEHVEAHIFGSALYRAEGIQGFVVCDDRFSYACLHQFIAEALVDLGTDSLNEVVEACKGVPGCRHSIGHGVLASTGYSFNDLQKAISICTVLPSEQDVQGCYGGVFMEYNLRRLLGTDQERPLGEDWFDPCEHVSKSARRVCYFWQPTLMAHKLKSPGQSLTPAALGTMGEKCRTIREKELRAVCFEGIGVSALNTGRSLNDGVSACTFIGSDEHDQALCRTSVARYIAFVQGTDQGRSVCLGLTGAYRQGCLQDVGNATLEKSYIGDVLVSEKDL